MTHTTAHTTNRAPSPPPTTQGLRASFTATISRIWSKITACSVQPLARMLNGLRSMRDASSGSHYRNKDKWGVPPDSSASKAQQDAPETTQEAIKKILNQAGNEIENNLSNEHQAIKMLFNPFPHAEFGAPVKQAADNLYKLTKLTALVGKDASRALQEDIKGIKNFLDSNATAISKNHAIQFSNRQQEIKNLVKSFHDSVALDNNINAITKKALTTQAQEALISITAAEYKRPQRTGPKTSQQAPPPQYGPRNQFRPGDQRKPKPDPSSQGARGRERAGPRGTRNEQKPPPSTQNPELKHALEALNLAAQKTRKDLRNTYLNLIRKQHPDKEGGITKNAQLINAEYDKLLKEKRWSR